MMEIKMMMVIKIEREMEIVKKKGRLEEVSLVSSQLNLAKPIYNHR